ncbi:uncharacterized protein MCAP_0864 [Adelges cooleyi]|uniref:uncharacterized protein MCAP_0864 n=1 Tax=Adelges cooleyi TaxID=133065 RepID=UPI00217F6E88|nr:uncharacterized protein MCAP_0864 [Adelges cooleyi]
MDSFMKYFNRDSSDDEANQSTVDGLKEYHDKNEDELGDVSLLKSVDSLSPEELNRHLIHKIQSLEEENGRLAVSGCCECGKPENGKKKATDFGARKISQLTEKVRELSSELQAVKSLCANNAPKNTVDELDVQRLREQLNISNQKTCNYRDQVSRLKKDLEIVKTALSNETGDSTLRQTILTSTGSCDRRGRAQYIMLLQKKNSELQAKLNLGGGGGVNGESVDNLLKKKSLEDARRAEKERRLTVEQQLKEARVKYNDLLTVSKKWECRCKALDVEMTVLRVRLEELQLKSEQNDKTIEEQQAEKTIEQQSKSLEAKDLIIKQLKNELKNNTSIPIVKTVDFSNPTNEVVHKYKQLENQQLLELLLDAHRQIRERIAAAIDLKNQLLKEKQRVKKIESKTGLAMKTVSSRNLVCRSSYQSLNELGSIANQSELKNQLDLVNEENVALKTHIDTLVMISEEKEQQFIKALNDLSQKFTNANICKCTNTEIVGKTSALNSEFKNNSQLVDETGK